MSMIRSKAACRNRSNGESDLHLPQHSPVRTTTTTTTVSTRSLLPRWMANPTVLRRKVALRQRWPLLVVLTLILFYLILSLAVPLLLMTYDRLAMLSAQPIVNTLHPAAHTVSVVIMNHGRPRVLQESSLLPTLLDHETIDEILICHSNPETQFEYQHPKVRNIDAVSVNPEKGLSLRFYFAQQAKNDWIIMVDDDQEVSTEAITALIANFARNPRRIVGRYGRQYSRWMAPLRNGYVTTTRLGPVEVVLTKFMILPKQLCFDFFRYEHLVHDVVTNRSKPKWNGEDIFISLVANHVYGIPAHGPFNNWAMPFNVHEAPVASLRDQAAAVSGNFNVLKPWQWWRIWHANHHASYRGMFWAIAKRRLAAFEEQETFTEEP